MTTSTYYYVLNIPHNASESEIKQSYRKKLLLLHPDKQRKDDRANNTVELQSVREAYKILIDPIKRAEYDKSLVTKINKDELGMELASGLKCYTLDDFQDIEDNDGVKWEMNCPRCRSKGSFEITENDLVNNIEENRGSNQEADGAYNLVIQCSSCSLWLCVKYYDMDDE